MLIRYIATAVLPALLLISCNAPTANNVESAVGSPTAGLRQTTAAVQTVAEQRNTATPLPSQIAAPTSAPPTAAPRATTAPTSLPEPTAAPTDAPQPTVAPATAVLEATSELNAASASPVPTAAMSAGQARPRQEILFLRKGTLIAFDVTSRKERKIADGVVEFVASQNGAQLALVRNEEGRRDVWIVQRDGSDLRQLTRDARAETWLSWSPDNAALVFASSSSAKPYQREWNAWSTWCAASEVRSLTVADGQATKLGIGCDPALSPDGKRIAYATPPQQNNAQGNGRSVNSIRLINRAGQNGWDFAKTTGAVDGQNAGQVVYAPAWSPDGKQLAYHRFIGTQVEVDIVLSEIGGSFEGKGKPMYSGAGWLLPARFAPDGRVLAIPEDNYSDARGFGGYDNWSVTQVRLTGSREIALPSGTLQAFGQQVQALPRGQHIAWSPDGTTVAVELPPGWRADLPNNEPIGVDEGAPGEVWLWKPGSNPQQKLITNVDAASPLVWLP